MKTRSKIIPILTIINLILSFCYLTKAVSDCKMENFGNLFDLHITEKWGLIATQLDGGETGLGNPKYRIGWGIITVVLSALFVLFCYFILKKDDKAIYYLVSPITNLVNLIVLAVLNKADLFMFLQYGGLSITEITSLHVRLTIFGWIFLIVSVIYIIILIMDYKQKHPAISSVSTAENSSNVSSDNGSINTENTVSAESPKNSPVNLEKK